MRKILLFFLIPLILSDDADDAAMLIAKAEIGAGIAAISEFVPGGQIIAGFLTPFFDSIFDMGQPDPNAVILEKLDALRDEIVNRLDRIENELKIFKNDILDQIKGTIYINSFGSELNILKNQIEELVSTLNIVNNSKSYSNNEKIVECAFPIGNNKNWMEKEHIILNLKNLADVLAGKSFSLTDQRDLYQIVYDSFIPNRMFSGEAYDDTDNYIEKIMNIYFLGCSAILQSLKNAQLMCNFTDKDIESLSTLVKAHYLSSAVGDPGIASVQIKSIADKVFDIKNKDSVVSHYLAFKYKKLNCRNIFINLGRTSPVPIANQINIKEFEYKTITAAYYRRYGPNKYYNADMKKMDDEILRFKSDVEDFLDPNQAAIVHHEMYDLYAYFLETYKNNTRFEFLSFLLDKDIDVNELLDERYEMNFFIHNYRDGLDTGYLIDKGDIHNQYYDFNLLHSGNKDVTQPLIDNKAIISKYAIPMYVKWFGVVGLQNVWYGMAQAPRKVARLLRGNAAIVPSTAEEIINSINNTKKYDNFTSMVFTGIDFSDNYVDLKNPQIITLGFSNYTYNDDNYTYNNESENFFFYDIHFMSLNKNIKSITMIHPINIKYKTKLRTLNNEEIFSTCIMDLRKNKKFKASCFVLKNDSEIDNIEVIPDFNFISDNNITIKMSSLANKQKNNIYNLENIDYSSYNIYILENSSIIKNENLLFSINGIINENITNINNTDLILSLNNNTNETCDVKCKIINIIDNNYTLNCESNENFKANLDSSISIINNNSILLLAFNGSESNIELRSNIKSRNYFKKSDNTLGAGAIALIVIIPIIAIISVIAIICFTKKDNKNNTNENSTIGSINVLNK